ncbi:hypothetical protein [Streptomyces fuscichromogenes]|uniref:Uncharacterized protein n=1 Tax=Streptomyces fuscichromogenes TaxID=1324013 RepID=A0A917XL04_9ACTN|nr:hypothetical protein GCM10011578_075530 [Streptomyces fuscichromogenes]
MTDAVDRTQVGPAPGSRGRPVPGRPRAGALGVDPFAIAEQDVHPCEPDKPLPIAVRTRKYLRSCGA